MKIDCNNFTSVSIDSAKQSLKTVFGDLESVLRNASFIYIYVVHYKILRHDISFLTTIESRQNEIYHEIYIFNLDSTMATINSIREASNKFGPVRNFNEGIGKVVLTNLFLFS